MGFYRIDSGNGQPFREGSPHVSIRAALLAYYKQLDREIQRNGIWIVTTNPGAYSPEENAMLEQFKQECKAQRIPLFIARGKDLPGGWQRYSNVQLILARHFSSSGPRRSVSGMRVTASLSMWCHARRSDVLALRISAARGAASGTIISSTKVGPTDA